MRNPRLKQRSKTNIYRLFDGTSRLGEVLAVVFRYIGDDWQICQRLVRLEFLAKSLTGEEVAQELINILSVQCEIESKYLLWGYVGWG